ncbi:MAG: thioredoxin fold domain-containing protein, partial [Sulfuricella sp.]
MLTLLRKSLLLAAVFLGLAQFAHAASEAPLASGLVHPGYEEQPAWFKNSFLDLREDVGEAAKHGKRVLLYFYQDGCPYCKKLLQDNLGQRPIADKTQKYFDVIAINMWGDREVTDLSGAATTEKDFAKQMKVMFTPTMVALDEKGGQALRVNGYYAPHQFDAALDYAGLHKEHELSFKEYLAQVAPAAAQGKLHGDARYLAPPYRLDRATKRGGKPLLVLFEQKQ